MNKTKNKWLLVLFGIIVIPSIIEGGLRIAGYIYYLGRVGVEKKLSNEIADVRILCVGDSFTFGAGAPPAYSYPSQLEKLLNDNSINKKYVVYNEGGSLPGMTSSLVLKNLEENILKYHPDIIIILIGMNNSWNLYGSNLILFTGKSWMTYLYRLDGFFTQFRIYKLLKIILGRVENFVIAMEFNNNDFKLGDSKTKDNYFGENGYADLPAELEILLESASDALCVKGDINQAIREYKKIIEQYPYNDTAYAILGHIYELSDDCDLAIKELNKAIELNPDNLFARQRLWNVHYRSGEGHLAAEEIKKIIKMHPNAGNMYARMLKIGLPSLEMSKNSIIQEKLLRYDLENIFKVVEKYNLQPVLLNYPPPTNDKYNIRADAASCHNAAFVDIYSAFKKLEEMPGYDVRNFFGEDEHCNANGYKIMAEEIYKVLRNIK